MASVGREHDDGYAVAAAVVLPVKRHAPGVPVRVQHQPSEVFYVLADQIANAVLVQQSYPFVCAADDVAAFPLQVNRLLHGVRVLRRASVRDRQRRVIGQRRRTCDTRAVRIKQLIVLAEISKTGFTGIGNRNTKPQFVLLAGEII